VSFFGPVPSPGPFFGPVPSPGPLSGNIIVPTHSAMLSALLCALAAVTDSARAPLTRPGTPKAVLGDGFQCTATSAVRLPCNGLLT
jgi:hypothetical protein